jgi:Fe-S-cluster containining protein
MTSKKGRAAHPAPARAALPILAQADALLEGWTCAASTECCRFDVTGREPYVTRVEWDALVAEVARQGRKLDAIVQAHARAAPDDARCAFLDERKGEHGRCTVYAARPLGCRTFFCERASGPNGERAASTEFPRDDIQEIARSLADASDGEKARPLRSWLQSVRSR